MFVTYPVEAISDNRIHESICYAFSTVCNAINESISVPKWPDTLPEQHRGVLGTKTALPKLLKKFEMEAKKLTLDQRTEFLKLFAQQNQITGLLDGTIPVPITDAALAPLVIAAKAVCDEGFLLLEKTGVRKAHYKIIWDSLISKTCPFCGFEPFDSPTLHREDEDHYLARKIYPLAAANLHNLVPMGSKCNVSYKGQADVLHMHGIRRKVLNPYGDIRADISLINSEPLGRTDKTPVWKVDLVPDIEEVQTWENIFSIRARITENQLAHYYETWLDDLIDWIKDHNPREPIDDALLVDAIDEFAAYSKKYLEAGHISLRSKVAEMLSHHCLNGDKALVAMIRDALPKQLLAA